MRRNLFFIVFIFFISCGKDIEIQKEIERTVTVRIPDDYEILEVDNETVVGDYVITYLLKFDSISMNNVIDQIRKSSCFSEKSKVDNNEKCWYKDDKGYSYNYYHYGDRGTLSVNCLVDTVQFTLYYQYAED